MKVKDSFYCLLILLTVSLGCGRFSSTESNTTNRPPINSATTPASSATPTTSTTESGPADKESSDSNSGVPVDSPTKKDFVGRYVKTIMSYDNVIELRENGTGALIINEGTKDEVRGTFNWKVDFNDAVFTVREPVVNKKVIDSGEMTVRAKLLDGGKKLQTDYDLMFRARGRDVFERK